MRYWIAVAVIIGAAFPAMDRARAHVVIHVDKSRQRMIVSIDGAPRYSFVVSTGRAGYGTPNGIYHPLRMERTWFSKEYYNSPMPHSIFFRGGYAIHGSYEISRLGGPASHGCIRLHPGDAAAVYALVKEQGMGDTTIVVSGANPARREVVREQEPRASWPPSRPYEGDIDSGGVTSYRGAGPYAAPNPRPFIRSYGDRDTVPRPRWPSDHRWTPFFFRSDDEP
jgi:hypothetical protein